MQINNYLGDFEKSVNQLRNLLAIYFSVGNAHAELLLPQVYSYK